ncbi:MAG: hypothetical protein R8G66_10930 [Cytophagales bacterium]|nr:hypothetical protein [Cytophagales bacterium]
MIINDRINQLIEVLDQNPNSFAELIGVRGAVVYNIIRGRRSKPSYDVLNKILLRFNEVNSEWLLRGEGKILDYTRKAKDAKELKSKRATVKNLKVSIERRLYELFDELKIEGVAIEQVQEISELVSHLIRENEEQKLKILDLHEGNASLVKVVREKLNLEV